MSPDEWWVAYCLTYGPRQIDWWTFAEGEEAFLKHAALDAGVEYPDLIVYFRRKKAGLQVTPDWFRNREPRHDP